MLAMSERPAGMSLVWPAGDIRRPSSRAYSGVSDIRRRSRGFSVGDAQGARRRSSGAGKQRRFKTSIKTTNSVQYSLKYSKEN